MRGLVVLMSLLAGCFAQKPYPCASPPLLTGGLTVSTQNEKLWTFAKYMYDAMGERIRLWEFGNYENQSFSEDILLNYRENVMYQINERNRTCKKLPLKADFQPIAVPKDATLVGQAVLGSSSGPGQGLLVNSWMGDLPSNVGKYFMTVTEFGCIPISTAAQTKDFGWVLTCFFDNVIGIPDPGQLNPPPFCEGVVLSEGEPVDFLSLFNKRK